MLKKLKHFRVSEDGAVTVDWVVLTSTIVALATVVVFSINESSSSLREKTADYLSAIEVGPGGP